MASVSRVTSPGHCPGERRALVNVSGHKVAAQYL